MWIICVLLATGPAVWSRAEEEDMTRIADLTRRLNDFAMPPQPNQIGLSIDNCNLLGQYHALLELENYSLAQFWGIIDWPHLESFFKTRLALRERLREMTQVGTVPDSCIAHFRNLFSMLRTMEETVSERIDEQTQRPSPRKIYSPSIISGLGTLEINPAFASEPLRSGDLLVTMGNSPLSAAISDIGHPGGHFSHVGIIFEDPQTRSMLILESKIEKGLTATPFERIMNSHQGRAAVYRYQNQKIAEEAANIIYQKYLDGLQTPSTKLLYDFSMNSSSASEVYCAEVVALGYRLASEKLAIPVAPVPLFPTIPDPFNRKFLEMIGMNANTFFAPEDIDVDPRFELIFEARNIKNTNKIRLQETILSKVYEWIENKNYKFITTYLGVSLTTSLALLARKTPLLGALLEDYVPLNIDVDVAAKLMILDTVVTALTDEINSSSMEPLDLMPPSIGAAKIMESLEEIRAKDYARFKTRKGGERPPLFHNLFRPD